MNRLDTYRFALAMSFLAGVLMLSGIAGCRNSLATVSTSKDSTHVFRMVSYRDTVVYTPADSARIRMIITDVVALRRMMEELRANPRVSRGEHNATITLRASGDTLIATASCDSIAHVLENAITTIQEKSDRITSLEHTVIQQAKAEKGTIPGWMRGTSFIILSVALLLIVAAFLYFKLILKRR
ncbi:MAG: hypothetical protein ABI432_08590 [Flavobacteriales bacterium]